MILDLFGSFLSNHEAIEDGFKAVSGSYEFVLVYDENNEVVCFTYDEEVDVQLMDKYLKNKNLKSALIRYEKEKINVRSERFNKISGKKIVLLDGEVVIFEEVMKLGNEKEIKGYKGKIPTARVNIYKTV